MLAHLDCSSGISGDKFLAALLDVGEADGRFSVDDLHKAIQALGLDAASVVTSRVTRGGISGLHIKVLTPAEKSTPAHRHWTEIRVLLESSPLDHAVRARAIRAFTKLAAAEAKIHDVSPENVHFHEVGAVDSIIDIVGVSLGLELLGIERLSCSAVALGAEGTISCAHGTLPVPAPTVLELLTGVPVEAGGASGELTTPTGAALLVANVDRFGKMPDMVLARVGHAAGTRNISGIPNITRLILGHPLTRSETICADASLSFAEEREVLEPVVLLETLLDHLSPEHVGFIAEELRECGPLDVWQVPSAMKKGRLGIELRVLARPDDAEALADRIHALTGSLGVRQTSLSRSILDREVLTCEGSWGPFRVKVSGAGASARARPEHDDIARISRESKVPYQEVKEVLLESARRIFDP